MKLIDARRDLYRRLAHKECYRSRAAYKLKELNKSYRIIGPGFYVLDLGCSPGGWTQVATELAGNKGKVMGVDTSYVEEIPNSHIIRGNIEDEIFEYKFEINDQPHALLLRSNHRSIKTPRIFY